MEVIYTQSLMPAVDFRIFPIWPSLRISKCSSIIKIIIIKKNIIFLSFSNAMIAINSLCSAARGSEIIEGSIPLYFHCSR